MGSNCSNTKDSFQIFLEERNIPDPDELLGKALLAFGSQLALLRLILVFQDINY